MNPLDQFAKGAKKFSLSSLYGRIALILYNGTTDKAALAESDGTLKVSNYGKAGSTLTSVKTETTGEQDFVIHGKDSGGTIDPLRTNANQQLQVEIVKDPVPTDPVILGAAAAVFDPGSTATETYEFYFNVVNYGSASAVVNVGVDLGGGTTFDRHYVESLTVPDNDQSGWFGPYQLAGDDDVVASCATATTLQIHIRAYRIE